MLKNGFLIEVPLAGEIAPAPRVVQRLRCHAERGRRLNVSAKCRLQIRDGSDQHGYRYKGCLDTGQVGIS